MPSRPDLVAIYAATATCGTVVLLVLFLMIYHWRKYGASPVQCIPDRPGKAGQHCTATGACPCASVARPGGAYLGDAGSVRSLPVYTNNPEGSELVLEGGGTKPPDYGVLSAV